MKSSKVGGYTAADGSRHELLVVETVYGSWEVLDACGDEARLVDVLSDEDDGRPQAEAVARDYLAMIGREGRATGDPVPEEGGTDERTHRRPLPESRAA